MYVCINAFVYEVMKDLQLEVASAMEVKDEGAVAVATEHWYDLALNTWRDLSGKKGAGIKPRQNYRRKALKWLLALERMLRLYGVSFKQFLQPVDKALREHPSTWPTLSLCLDQGSDGWAGLRYLLHGMPCCIYYTVDASHRCWNDVQLGIRDCNLWSIVNILTIVFNIDHGPWSDARWYQQGRECVRAYIKSVDRHRCPLWQSLYDRICEDTGDTCRMAEEGFEKLMWEKLEDAWTKQADKVSMTRWFAWIDACDNFLGVWHSRLVTLLFMCITLGLINPNKRNDIINATDLVPSN